MLIDAALLPRRVALLERLIISAPVPFGFAALTQRIVAIWAFTRLPGAISSPHQRPPEASVTAFALASRRVDGVC